MISEIKSGNSQVIIRVMGQYMDCASYMIKMLEKTECNLFLPIKYATDEVEKIKQQNPNGNSNAINLVCFSKGGTSVGNIFLGLFIAIVISIIYGMIFPSTTISTM